MPSRRDFIASAVFGSASLAFTSHVDAQENASKPAPVSPPAHPVIVTKTTGLHSLDTAYKLLERGGDTLDAATLVCKAQEDDPNDMSVGLGGLPNEDGVVELDCSCMHGPTRRAGAVGAVKNIKNVSLLARAVMDHTGHVMLVGDEAEVFAIKMGFTRENLLTDRARKIWLLWKETMSRQSWWGPGLSDPKWKPPSGPNSTPNRSELLDHMRKVAASLGIAPEDRESAIDHVLHRAGGTIHCSTVNRRGEMSGMTTTSGLEWKIPGRVGDSPIIGAGCYTDQDVGSAGATGSGEENIRVAGAHTIVENMRRGMLPQEAGMDALKRLTRLYNGDMQRLRYIDMIYYILRRDGAFAGVSLWSASEKGTRHRYALHDGRARLEDTVALFQGSSIEWPPVPELPTGM